MHIPSKIRHILLAIVLMTFSLSQAEAQFWNKLKNAAKNKAEEIAADKISGKGNEKAEETKKSPPAPKKNEQKKQVRATDVKPVKKASNDTDKKSANLTAPYAQDFPLTTDETYKQYISQLGSATGQLPECYAILLWGAKAYISDQKINSRNFWGGKWKGKYLLAGLQDDLFQPTFGTTFGQWADQDMKDFESKAFECRQHYATSINKERAASRGNAQLKQRHSARVKLYGNGLKYIDHRLNPRLQPASRVDTYGSLIAHQREIYPEYKKAQTLRDAQQAEATAMSATKANIYALIPMAKDPQFSYLRPTASKAHTEFLNNRILTLANDVINIAITHFDDFPETLTGLRELNAFHTQTMNELGGGRRGGREFRKLKFNWSSFNQSFKTRTTVITTKIVDNAIDDLGDFSNDLEGLRKLTAYRTEIQNNMGRTRVPRWSDFEKAYGIEVNDKAESAIEDFEEELNSLPVTAVNLNQIRRAVSGLFKYPPAPNNIQAYRFIAKEQERVMLQNLQKVACYKTLDNIDLDEDDRDIALLGYKGETTLGLFVCAMNKRGYQFQEYDSAGLFSSTSTLNILSPRGITLSIDMEEVEAVKGREMLVGILVKDVTSETKFTLSSWQDYAAKLAGI